MIRQTMWATGLSGLIEIFVRSMRRQGGIEMNTMTTESELLRRFVADRSETAFREFVGRHIDFVYATALRQVGGDTHLAKEVAQTVFLDLARKARSLVSRSSLTGWLYTSTRFAAGKALRSRSRRRVHETEAHLMQHILSASSAAEIDWNELRPVLDAALHELGEADREAILLRYFEGRSLAEVGAAVGLAENSARMRVDRALERLRTRLARRGITSTAAALGVVLASQPTVAAPPGLAASIAGASLAGAAVLGSGSVVTLALSLIEFMNTAKIILGTIGLVAAFGLGTYFGGYRLAREETSRDIARTAASESELRALRDENRRLASELAARSSRPATTATSPTAGAPAGSVIPAEQWRVLAELKSKKMVDARMAFVNPGGKLTDAFATLFELTPIERDKLQDSVSRATQRIAELEAENAAVTRDDKGRVIISVKPFVAAGSELYDGMMKSFAETLGPERATAFMALGSEQVENVLGRFGAAQRTVTFSYDPAKGKAPYEMRDEVRVQGWGTSNSSSDYKTLQEAVDRAGTIAKLLPADFGAPK